MQEQNYMQPSESSGLPNEEVDMPELKTAKTINQAA